MDGVTSVAGGAVFSRTHGWLQGVDSQTGRQAGALGGGGSGLQVDGEP